MAGTLALGFLAFVNGGAALGTTIYWCVVSVTAAMWAAAVLQGLRFTVRYGIFAGAQFTFLLLTVIGLGITPNWSFFAIVLLVAVSFCHSPIQQHLGFGNSLRICEHRMLRS